LGLLSQPFPVNKRYLDTENTFSYLGWMERYKAYWVSSYAQMTFGYGDRWHARGSVSIIRPNGSVIDVKRFEPTEVFPSKEETGSS
jgi:hypothetical protein